MKALTLVFQILQKEGNKAVVVNSPSVKKLWLKTKKGCRNNFLTAF